MLGDGREVGQVRKTVGIVKEAAGIASVNGMAKVSGDSEEMAEADCGFEGGGEDDAVAARLEEREPTLGGAAEGRFADEPTRPCGLDPVLEGIGPAEETFIEGEGNGGLGSEGGVVGGLQCGWVEWLLEEFDCVGERGEVGKAGVELVDGEGLIGIEAESFGWAQGLEEGAEARPFGGKGRFAQFDLKAVEAGLAEGLEDLLGAEVGRVG